jgi:hypothetical protein
MTLPGIRRLSASTCQEAGIEPGPQVRSIGIQGRMAAKNRGLSVIHGDGTPFVVARVSRRELES